MASASVRHQAATLGIGQAATPKHPIGAVGRGIILVGAPVPHIAEHIVPRLVVRLLLTDRVGSARRVIAITGDVVKLGEQAGVNSVC